METTDKPMSSRGPDELPLLLTVEEAGALLRIGRGTAYELARVYRATEGREGIPVVSFGRVLRVPRAALLRLLGVDEEVGRVAESRPWLG